MKQESQRPSTAVVVIVEDEPDLLDVVAEILADEGYVVIALHHPQLISLSATWDKPALFLLDLMLPGMSGMQLARSLRNDGFPQTPMLAMSASPSMLRQAADSALFQGTLAKPFDITALLEMVERYAF